VISLQEAELELRRHVEGLPHSQPLARFTIADLWVAFRNTNQVREEQTKQASGRVYMRSCFEGRLYGSANCAEAT
jgi:hypothetical protein